MFNGAGRTGGGVTAPRANGKRGRPAAVANGERGTRCHVPRLGPDGGAAPSLGRAVLYWANWERPGRVLRGVWGLHRLPQTSLPHPGQPGGASAVVVSPPPCTFNPPPPVNPPLLFGVNKGGFGVRDPT